MKLMVLGFAGHGKDTVCEELAKVLGCTWKSSSEFAAEKVIMPALGEKYGYASVQECLADKEQHRKEWYDLIHEYNTPHAARLVQELYEEYDIYCGLRHHKEFLRAKELQLFDYCIWVDASERLPPEGRESCTVSPYMADYVFDNNWPERIIPDTTKDLVDHILDKEHLSLVRDKAIVRWVDQSNK